MLFFPYSAALHLAKRPYVTYAVIFVCVLVHQFQWNNREVIKHSAEDYCLSLKQSAAVNTGVDEFRQHYITCKNSLISLHNARDVSLISDQIVRQMKKEDEYSVAAEAKALENIKNHYQVFKSTVPESLDRRLMYYPDDTNLWRMVTATFAHADWLHVISNILFFIAFATGVEGIINNKLKYSIIFMSLLFICHISYSLYSAGSAIAVPTMGLSGVVMGMMGVAAYLMPNARIKVFIWGYRFVNYYYIRVWVLALVYIGWDTLNLYYFGQDGGVNLVAHVSGGFAGFFIALIFLGDRRLAAREELADEVDYQVSRKKDSHSYDLSSTYGRKSYNERLQVRQNKKDYEKYLQEIYTLVTVHKDSEAMLLIMSDYSRYQQDYQLLQQMFERIQSWGSSRTLLCTGRMLVDLLFNMNQYARAVSVVKQCQQLSKEFIVADPSSTLLIVRSAIELHEYDVAYWLLHKAEERYDKSVDTTAMQIREAELCLMYMAEPEQAEIILKRLLKESNPVYLKDIMALVKLLP